MGEDDGSKVVDLRKHLDPILTDLVRRRIPQPPRVIAQPVQPLRHRQNPLRPLPRELDQREIQLKDLHVPFDLRVLGFERVEGDESARGASGADEDESAAEGEVEGCVEAEAGETACDDVGLARERRGVVGGGEEGDSDG